MEIKAVSVMPASRSRGAWDNKGILEYCEKIRNHKIVVDENIYLMDEYRDVVEAQKKDIKFFEKETEKSKDDKKIKEYDDKIRGAKDVIVKYEQKILDETIGDVVEVDVEKFHSEFRRGSREIKYKGYTTKKQITDVLEDMKVKHSSSQRGNEKVYIKLS